MNSKSNLGLVAVSGNTYPVKEELKALGSRWNADSKAWMVPVAKLAEAQKLVAGAGVKKSYSREFRSGGAGPRTGCSCGSRQNYSQSSDCASCKFDQDDN